MFTKTGLDLLYSSFFSFGFIRRRVKAKKKEFRLNKQSVVKPLCHVINLSKKVSKFEHIVYLKTNPFQKWETLNRSLFFSSSILICVLFCYSYISLTKLKTFVFGCRLSGGKSHICGVTLFEDSVWKDLDIINFCINFYGVSSCINMTLLYMIIYSKDIEVVSDIAYNFKRPPLRTGRIGSIPRLDFYYKGKSSAFNLIISVCIKKPGLIMLLIRGLYSSSFIIKSVFRLSLESNFKHKGHSVLSDWSIEEKERLLYIIFSNTPLNYWSIYSHHIRTPFLRSCLLDGVYLKGDYYISHVKSVTIT